MFSYDQYKWHIYINLDLNNLSKSQLDRRVMTDGIKWLEIVEANGSYSKTNYFSICEKVARPTKTKNVIIGNEIDVF